MGRGVVIKLVCILAAAAFLLAFGGCEGPMLASLKLKLATENENVSAPTYSPAEGTYDIDQNVTISSAAGSTVYYTTDGSTPTSSSTAYISPILISGNGAKTIKAYAAKTGMKDSSVAAATYTIAYPEFAGTWVWTIGGGQVETVVATATTETITDTGTTSGTLSLSVTSYDVTLKHIQTAVISGTGSLFSGISVGTVYYVLYNIVGSSMYTGRDTVGYPTTAPNGPYIKQ